MQTPAYYRQAASQLGYSESEQNAALQEYLANGGVNLDPAVTAWCAGFVNASLQQAGQEGTGSLAARSFLDWGQPTETPQIGDVAVFSRGSNPAHGHVGFYAGEDPERGIRVLGGNQGNAVSYNYYPTDRLLGYRRADPAPDVRTKMDMPMPQQPPMMTGSIPNNPYGPAPQAGFADQLFNDPWVSLGANILANPAGALSNPMTGIARGFQATQQQMQERDRLMQYGVQNRLSAIRAMGGEIPSAYEQANARRQLTEWEGPDGQRKILAYDQLSGRYLDPATGQPMDPYSQGLMPTKFSGRGSEAKQDLYIITSPDGAVRTVAGSPNEIAEQTQPGDTVTKVGTRTGSKGKAGSTDNEGFLALLDNVQSLADELETSGGQAALGTPGAIGAQLSAWAGVADQVIGTGFADKVNSWFGGQDPRVVRARLQAAVLPVARLLVDPKGPLSGAEQEQAKRLVTVLEGEGVISSKQAMQVLRQTIALAKKAAGATGGPSSMAEPVPSGAASSGLPPGVTVEITP